MALRPRSRTFAALRSRLSGDSAVCNATPLGTRPFAASRTMRRTMTRLKLGVLISGRGSNLQALIDAAADPAYPAEIVLVISNRPEAPGLERAARAGIEHLVIADPSRQGFAASADAALRKSHVALVALAGYLRILDSWLCRGVARSARQHPPVSAAGLPRAACATPGAGGRRPLLRLHRAFRARRGRYRADHRASRRAGARGR